MVATDKIFAGAIPEIYDRLFVPMIFEPYAQDLADRVAKFKPQNVLEIAAGTGVLTRAMACRLNAETRIVASDLNQPMLDRASARQPKKVASSGSKRTLSRFPSSRKCSISQCVDSGSCSTRTRSRGIRKPTAF